MRNKQKDLFLLILLLVALLALNYNFLDNQLEKLLTDSQTVRIKRVVDGDTVKTENLTLRLLGINTPERGELYYEEAKLFLETLVLNKTARLEFGRDKKDKYGRTLAYIFIDGKNINLELVKNGFANIYFLSGKDEYYDEFLSAWENCNKNLCKKSDDICARCIKLGGLNPLEQKITIKNTCLFSCELTGWELKHEGRKKFIFPETTLNSNREVSISVYPGSDFLWNESRVLNPDTDSVFLKDGEGELVLWESY